MSIFVTGDTHGLQDFNKLHIFAGQHPELTENDYVIIAGDFGAIWSEQTLVQELSYYKELPFTVLFVDGNHENFDILNAYPVEEWHGGKVHVIRRNIIHLMRGQVFELEDKTFFTFGGATSIDKFMRRKGISWWEQELPTLAEFDEGFANLKRYGNKVDYIITHSCGRRALAYPQLKKAAGIKTGCPEVGMISEFEDRVIFKRWYFGHFHIDAKLGDKYTALYQEVVKVE